MERDGSGAGVARIAQRDFFEREPGVRIVGRARIAQARLQVDARLNLVRAEPSGWLEVGEVHAHRGLRRRLDGPRLDVVEQRNASGSCAASGGHERR